MRRYAIKLYYYYYHYYFHFYSVLHRIRLTSHCFLQYILSMAGYESRTLLRILDVLSNPIFCRSHTLPSIFSFFRFSCTFLVIVPKSPMMIGRINTLITYLFQILDDNSYLRSAYFPNFVLPLSLIVMSNGKPTVHYLDGILGQYS